MTYYKCGSIHPTQNSNVVVDTASGSVANFQTPLAMPLVKTKFDVNAVQDLHGYDHPWPAGGGKNIGHFGADNLTSSQRITINYTSDNSFTIETTGTYARHMYKINGKQGETVTVSFKGKGIATSGYNRVIFNRDGSWSAYYSYGALNVSGDGLAEYSKTFTLEDDYFYIGFYWTADVNVSETAEIQIFQVEYSSSKTSFAPYENICPISGVSAVNVIKCGANLLDLSALIDNNYYSLNNDGSLKILQTDDRSWGIVPVAFFLKAGNYILSRSSPTGYLAARTSLDNYSANYFVTRGVNTKTFTLSSDAYIKIKIGYGETAETYPYSSFESLNVGSSATPFESYNGSTTLINLGGTYYGGYVTQDKDGHRQFEVTHGSVDWISSDWGRSNSGGNWANYIFYARFEDMKIGSFLKSDIYQMISSGSIGNMDNYKCRAGSSNNYIYVRNDDYMDSAAFKSAMENHQILYELETPFTVDLPDGTPIKSFAGINNIFCDTGDTSLQFRKIG